MYKRQLYARVALGLCLVIGRVVSASAAPQNAAPQDGACAACLGVVMLPGQLLLLPEDLHEIVVLIRVLPDMTQDLTAGIAAVRTHNGKPAVLLGAATTAGRAEEALRLKVRLSDWRARLPSDVQIALDVDGASAELLDAVAPYADVLVSGEQARLANRRAWRHLGAMSVAEAVGQTRRGGHERWIVDLPTDVVSAHEWLRALAAAAAPTPDIPADRVEVRGGPILSADEIVARHQAAARRQAATIAALISSGSLTLTFEAPGFPAPVTIASETIVYQAGGRTELEQRSVRVNGLAFEGRGIPRLPLIEPERVSALPLTITLDAAYRYRRLDDDTIDGIRCYVIAFEPLGRGSRLAGRAWIAVDGFHLVRTAAAQTSLRGPIVSSEQVDDFRAVTPDAWLLVRSDVRQLYEGAGHRTPIHRRLELAHVEVNPADFDRRLRAAHSSGSVMLRETADGYRYLRRSGGAESSATGTGPPAVVEERGSRVRTLAGGVIVDPNISIPLPFAGLNYTDFDLFGTGTQFTGFFGGSYGQLAFAVPALAGSRWQLGGRAFATAASYNDRSFHDGREHYDENLRQRPAHASAWLLRPLSARFSFRAGYELDYVQLRRGEATSAAFTVPADQVVHGVRLALEGQRGGWAGNVWWNPARRAGWNRWGSSAADYAPSHADFQRYGATVSRTTLFSPAFVTRIEGSIMGGRDLDRFSRYSFGSFDNRLRGYPAASVRYDRGAILRGTASWSFSTRARLDLFADTAAVRDRGYGLGYRSYMGTGAAVEAPLPFGILGAVEWGYGFRGVNGDGSRGTQVIRVSVFKVF